MFILLLLFLTGSYSFNCTSYESLCSYNGLCINNGTECECYNHYITYNNVTEAQCNYEQKNTIVAFVLELVFGWIGPAGYFYIGQYFTASIMLSISFVCQLIFWYIIIAYEPDSYPIYIKNSCQKLWYLFCDKMYKVYDLVKCNNNGYVEYNQDSYKKTLTACLLLVIIIFVGILVPLWIYRLNLIISGNITDEYGANIIPLMDY